MSSDKFYALVGPSDEDLVVYEISSSAEDLMKSSRTSTNTRIEEITEKQYVFAKKNLEYQPYWPIIPDCERCDGTGCISAQNYSGPEYARPEYKCHDCDGTGNSE